MQMDRQTEARQIDRATNDRLRLADTQMYGATNDRLANRQTDGQQRTDWLTDRQIRTEI